VSQPLSIILCRDRNQRTEQEVLVAALTAAMERRPQCDVTVLPHLVDLAPNGPGMRLLRSISGPMVVLAWLYPQAAFWVLDANGVRGRMGGGSPAVTGTATTGRGFTRAGIPDREIWCLDLRQYGQPEPYLAEIERIAASGATGVSPVPADSAGEMPVPPSQARVVDEATRERWYPVIDFHRCTNCLECLNFCLFGVYSLDEGDAIVVEQPDACRSGCPACARICPQGAILFPQHKDPGIAGDPQAAREGLKLDLSQLFGGKKPEQLAATERDRALAERDLDRLVDSVDELDV
jgi:NAD-dependent dihydropyrimidine dehydrogenase PreA subunit